jgi:hypothetical protein
MPYELLDLVVDRVDLVDEGANSAAFIELYKRKEKSEPMDFNEILSKMKPEHAEVVSKAFEDKDAELAKARDDLSAATQELADKTSALTEANDALAKANAELETLKSNEPAGASEEELLKSMPEGARELFQKMRAQKEAAEEQVRKAAEEQAEAEAVAKAAGLKAIPVEQSKLVGIVKSCTPEMMEVLTLANNAIEAAVLGEVGKNKGNGAATGTADAWEQIEKKAQEIAERDGVTKEKAISKAVQENPDLYREYLEGGAN